MECFRCLITTKQYLCLRASCKNNLIKDVQNIFSLGHRLKGSKFQMFRDLPTEIVKRRKVQMETFKTAKRRGIPAAFSQAQPDKLYIRGRLWPVGKELPP